MRSDNLPTTIIIGPTAGGKTQLAVQCAHVMKEQAGIEAEIISADSMLLYRGLNIGSAKPTHDERGGIPHHLIDICDPRDSFSVSQWLDAANNIINEVNTRKRWPIVVGGTHLYVKALLEGLFDGPAADANLRAELTLLSKEELRIRLEACDPVAAAKLHSNDIRRTVRAIEVFTLTGTPISEHQRQWDQHEPTQEKLLVGLQWPTDEINRRINLRVKLMFEKGLLAEARDLYEHNLFGMQSREAVGYKQLIDLFEGRTATLDEAIERVKIDTRHLAKSQRTWAKRLRITPGSMWLDAELQPAESWARHVVTRVLAVAST